jgi:hypothetical protein
MCLVFLDCVRKRREVIIIRRYEVTKMAGRRFGEDTGENGGKSASMEARKTHKASRSRSI